MKATPIFFFFCLLCSLVLWNCTRHEVEMKPVEIKPIHITVDVNVRVQKAVDDFYGDIYGDEE
ncbi:MAG: hypothetical protein SCH71_11490 [Desulfobulbaceae bacterium]|nr:hypothetical protein [Desulfobulbaceae bacterium]